jgi:Prohead core protein protease.
MADSKKLIVDWIPFNPSKNIITEATGGEPMKVKGVLQRAEAKNQNGRVYPKDVLKEEAKRYKKDRVKENRALGELDHPDSEVVNLQNASHKVTSMEWNGNDLVGEVQVLTTPSGNILQELFRNNVNVGISSRGLGSVKESADGTLIVGEDFELIAFDFVSNPSTHGAFMEPEKITENSDPQLIKEAKQAQERKDVWDPVESRVSEIISEMNCNFRGKCDIN